MDVDTGAFRALRDQVAGLEAELVRLREEFGGLSATQFTIEVAFDAGRDFEAGAKYRAAAAASRPRPRFAVVPGGAS
jgi:hypothetical protein